MRIVAFMILALSVVGLFIAGHETVHGLIFVHAGCEEVRYGATWEYIYTECVDEGDAYDGDFAREMNMLNEIVGYTICPFLVMLVIMEGMRFYED